MSTDSLQKIDPTIICAIITAAGTILSALIAWLVSKSTANKELKKLQLMWEREDIVSSDDDFAKMADSVARYIQLNHSRDGADAAGKISALRARETGALAESLDSLYLAVSGDRYSDYPDFQKIERCLSEVIEQKRKKQSHAQLKYQKKPDP